MLTADMLHDAQSAFAAEIEAGVEPAAAVKVALSAALEHFTSDNLKVALESERDHRKAEALCIRHAMFSDRPVHEDVQHLISYLARWNTSFSTSRLARVTGASKTQIHIEVVRWMDANPGRLILDVGLGLFRTPRAAKRAAHVLNLSEGTDHDKN